MKAPFFIILLYHRPSTYSTEVALPTFPAWGLVVEHVVMVGKMILTATAAATVEKQDLAVVEEVVVDDDGDGWAVGVGDWVVIVVGSSRWPVVVGLMVAMIVVAGAIGGKVDL